MDPMEEEEVEVEEEEDWGRLDDLDGEYEICSVREKRALK